MTRFFDYRGVPRRIEDMNAADKLMDLKAHSGSSPWLVIEMCFKIWAETQPIKYKSYLIYLQNIRETRKDRKFASTYDRKTGGTLRYTLDIPEKVLMMIRCVYSPTELPMNREFFHEFARRFPKFRIAEKL